MIIKEASTADDTWEDEYRLRKSNGEYAYVHDRGSGRSFIPPTGNLSGRNRRDTGYYAERKRSEEIIRASEEKYKADIPHKNAPARILQHLSDLLTADTLHIVEVNDAAMEKYGFDKDEFPGGSDNEARRDLHPAGEMGE